MLTFNKYFTYNYPYVKSLLFGLSLIGRPRYVWFLSPFSLCLSPRLQGVCDVILLTSRGSGRVCGSGERAGSGRVDWKYSFDRNRWTKQVFIGLGYNSTTLNRTMAKPVSIWDWTSKFKLYGVADTMDTKSTLTDQLRNLFGDASGIMRDLRSRPNQEWMCYLGLLYVSYTGQCLREARDHVNQQRRPLPPLSRRGGSEAGIRLPGEPTSHGKGCGGMEGRRGGWSVCL